MSIILNYIEKQKADDKAYLLHLHELVHRVVPTVEDTWSYGIPTFKYKGKYMIAFAANKNFLSLYPGGEVGEVMKDDLKKYQTGRGTLSFKADAPIKDDVLEKVILFCRDGVDERLRAGSK